MKTAKQLMRMNAIELDAYVKQNKRGYALGIDWERGNWHKSGHWEARFWNGDAGYQLEFEKKAGLVEWILDTM